MTRGGGGSATGLIGRVTGWVLRHRRIVLGTWLVLLVAGGAAAGQVSKRLTFDFALPGQPGYETARQIVARYGNGGDQSASLVVVTTPAAGGVRADAPQLAAAFDALRRAEPSLRVVDEADTGAPLLVTGGGRTTYALVFAPQPQGFSPSTPVAAAAGLVRRALPSGDQVTTTGLDQLSSAGSGKGESVLGETLIGGAGALVVLLFVFGSLLAFLPLVVAAASITTTFLIVLGLTYLTEVSFVVEFLIALVGLGVAIDYSLLVVTRWREERHHGRPNHEAVAVAMDTAGRAVVFSGLTVGIALISLVVLPVPGLRSIGVGGMLIPLVSVLVTLTLLPAVLGGVGLRLDWPRLRHEGRASRPWSAWARRVVRWRWAGALGALALLGVLTVPFFSMRVGMTGPQALAKTGPARAAYDQLLADGVPSGVLTPLEVLVRRDAATAAAGVLDRVPGVRGAFVPTGSDSNRAGTTVVLAVPSGATLNSSEAAVVTRARRALAAVPGVIGVAGVGAIQLDYVHAVFDNFPLMLGVIALLTFLLLARAFRSLLLPLKAVVLNLLSLAATFGLVTWFWQEGHGSHAVFGIPATGAITFWVPLMIFAFLFGLSMDYEVFILARIREEYDSSGSTATAVVEGLGRTGRLVTSAALILFLAFASLASAGFTDLKVFATALGAGILLDATVVRALLLPSLVSLLGRWNWWMPAWLARVLMVGRPARAAPTTDGEPELVPTAGSGDRPSGRVSAPGAGARFGTPAGVSGARGPRRGRASR